MSKECMTVLTAVCDGFEQLDVHHTDMYKDVLKSQTEAFNKLSEIEAKLLRKQK